MNARLIGSIPLLGANELYNYPFVNKTSNGVRVSIITREGNLKSFCELYGISTSMLWHVRMQKEHLLFQTEQKSSEKDTSEVFICHIISSNGNRQEIIMPRDSMNNQDIRIVSERYLVCKDKILFLPDLREVMKIPLPANKTNRGVHCRYAMKAEEGKLIAVYEEAGVSTAILADVENKTIVKRLDNVQNRNYYIKPLGVNHFVWSNNNARKRVYEIAVYNKNLEVEKIIPFHRFISNFYADHNKIYVENLGEKRVCSVDCYSGNKSVLPIPGYKESWVIIGVINGYLYFQISTKKVGVFCAKTEQWNVFSFKEDISSCFMQDEKVYIVTGLEPEQEIGTGKLLKEGELKVYCLNKD